jgi:FkbM family methyltransferase
MLRTVKKLVTARFPDLAQSLHHYRFARTLRRRPVVETPLGFRFGGSEMMENGSFEPAETALFRELAADVDVYIDVGANIGYFVCLMRSRGKHVIACEPLPKNTEYLFANLLANGWSDVEVLPVGLGSQPRIVGLYGEGTGASLVPGWAGAPSRASSTIPINTLDNLLGDRFRDERLLIKIDVEGGELDVLKGAHGLLGRDLKPRWLIEICLTEHHPQGLNPDFVATFELMFDHGYRASSVEAGMRRVTLADVRRWYETRKRDFGYVSFFFDAPA